MRQKYRQIRDISLEEIIPAVNSSSNLREVEKTGMQCDPLSESLRS